MKITIYGAGAIGGHLGALLSREGVEVSLIARGAHLAMIQNEGLTLQQEGKESFTVRPNATDDPSTLGPQDYVVVSLKSHQAPGVVDEMQPLLGPETAVATAMNGVPWWYFYKLTGQYENHRVLSVDPHGMQWEGIGPERAIGCITYVAAEVIAPGVVKSGGSGRYFIGEPDGVQSLRCLRLSQLVNKTGIAAQVRDDIRKDLWLKIMGNSAFNPTGALTLATVGEMINDPEVEGQLRLIMDEVTAVGRALGAEPSETSDYRIENSRQNAMPHKSSMLQDLERGRMMEVNQIIGAARELGQLVGVPTPTIDTIYALIRLRARIGGMLPD